MSRSGIIGVAGLVVTGLAIIGRMLWTHLEPWRSWSGWHVVLGAFLAFVLCALGEKRKWDS